MRFIFSNSPIRFWRPGNGVFVIWEKAWAMLEIRHKKTPESKVPGAVVYSKILLFITFLIAHLENILANSLIQIFI